MVISIRFIHPHTSNTPTTRHLIQRTNHQHRTLPAADPHRDRRLIQSKNQNTNPGTDTTPGTDKTLGIRTHTHGRLARRPVQRRIRRTGQRRIRHRCPQRWHQARNRPRNRLRNLRPNLLPSPARPPVPRRRHRRPRRQRRWHQAVLHPQVPPCRTNLPACSRRKARSLRKIQPLRKSHRIIQPFRKSPPRTQPFRKSRPRVHHLGIVSLPNFLRGSARPPMLLPLVSTNKASLKSSAIPQTATSLVFCANLSSCSQNSRRLLAETLVNR
mmetsp:Transcript_9802/g.20520  ORF Transcript_9802/g.20520 Transcript_9802/m.20520 type:complete len:270 (+) Transcript_9802:208-1017(+)